MLTKITSFEAFLYIQGRNLRVFVVDEGKDSHYHRGYTNTRVYPPLLHDGEE